MNKKLLIETATALLAEGKGMLAMDESIPTCNQRFAAFNIPETEEYRRTYRELILTTPHLNDFISGAILCDETMRQSTRSQLPFLKLMGAAGIVPGVKVDLGAKPLAGLPHEKVTEGLDGLRERLQEYFEMGARFAKWRAVFSISKNSPSAPCILANAHALARYAALCQEVGLVPIVEPETLMDGEHNLVRSSQTSEKILRGVFDQLYQQNVFLEGMILKPNMILRGLACVTQDSVDDIAAATVECLLRAVPAAVPGVAFLSGGQSGELAFARLSAMNSRLGSKTPWALTSSFARAIQQPALEIWRGQGVNTVAAQKAIYKRAQCSHAARLGEYSSALKTP